MDYQIFYHGNSVYWARTSKRWNNGLQKYSGLLISSQREEEYRERVKKAAGKPRLRGGQLSGEFPCATRSTDTQKVARYHVQCQLSLRLSQRLHVLHCLISANGRKSLCWARGSQASTAFDTVPYTDPMANEKKARADISQRQQLLSDARADLHMPEGINEIQRQANGSDFTKHFSKQIQNQIWFKLPVHRVFIHTGIVLQPAGRKGSQGTRAARQDRQAEKMGTAGHTKANRSGFGMPWISKTDTDTFENLII